MTLRLPLLLIISISLFVTACASKTESQNSAEEHFRKGESFFERGLYIDAIESWEKTRDTYYSPELNMLAELKIAEAYYKSERYQEAAAAYADFIKLHPNDRRIDDVLYRLGLSYYQQIPTADRDQSNTRKALLTLQELQRRFPEYPNAKDVAALIQRCKNHLAEHDAYVGRFYLQQKQYQAAIKRLQNVLTNYPDFINRDEVLFYLGKAYLEDSQQSHAEAIFAQLAEQYPASEYNQEAMELLE